MNLDTLTLAPDQRPQPETPIQQAAQQLIDHITRILTTEHATRTHDTHEAETRATNAEREYTRLCHAYETLNTKHEAALKELTTTRTQLDDAIQELQRFRTSTPQSPAPSANTPTPADTTPVSSALPTTGTEQP